LSIGLGLERIKHGGGNKGGLTFGSACCSGDRSMRNGGGTTSIGLRSPTGACVFSQNASSSSSIVSRPHEVCGVMAPTSERPKQWLQLQNVGAIGGLSRIHEIMLSGEAPMAVLVVYGGCGLNGVVSLGVKERRALSASATTGVPRAGRGRRVVFCERGSWVLKGVGGREQSGADLLGVFLQARGSSSSSWSRARM